MAKRKDAAPAASVTTTPAPRWFVYAGPHPLIGRAGVIFARDEPREVPAAIGDVLAAQDDMRESDPPARTEEAEAPIGAAEPTTTTES